MTLPNTTPDSKQRLISELQTRGVRVLDDAGRIRSRKGGAGPSDHGAVTVMGTTVMVPIHTRSVDRSPYAAELEQGQATLFRNGDPIGPIFFPEKPKFYDLSTADGIPYGQIAQLHAKDVLATTLLQTCIRYTDPETRCQFCAIGDSLAAGRTIARKTPEQLAEVAEAAIRLDGVTHMVMTTGTPGTPDRGAAILAEATRAVKASTGLPIQAQCEPPDRFDWFEVLRDAGVDSLGMHLEAINPDVRATIMPGKADVPVSYYLEAFEHAVAIFGRGQVSTYLLAGLGDTVEELLAGCHELISLGVYPFVVPFVPISGTRLESQAPPTAEFMTAVLRPLGALLKNAGMTSDTIKAGCGKCGACSALSTFEQLS